MKIDSNSETSVGNIIKDALDLSNRFIDTYFKKRGEIKSAIYVLNSTNKQKLREYVFNHFLDYLKEDNLVFLTYDNKTKILECSLGDFEKEMEEEFTSILNSETFKGVILEAYKNSKLEEKNDDLIFRLMIESIKEYLKRNNLAHNIYFLEQTALENKNLMKDNTKIFLDLVDIIGELSLEFALGKAKKVIYNANKLVEIANNSFNETPTPQLGANLISRKIQQYKDNDPNLDDNISINIHENNNKKRSMQHP